AFPQLARVFFYPPAPPQIYTLSLHDALPISSSFWDKLRQRLLDAINKITSAESTVNSVRNNANARTNKKHKNQSLNALLEFVERSEEHTSELQSRFDLVCRLLLEKKNRKTKE